MRATQDTITITIPVEYARKWLHDTLGAEVHCADHSTLMEEVEAALRASERVTELEERVGDGQNDITKPGRPLAAPRPGTKWTTSFLQNEGDREMIKVEYNIYGRKLDVLCACGREWSIDMAKPVDDETAHMCPSNCGRGVAVAPGGKR